MHRTQNPTGTAADTDDTIVVTPADILRGAARYLEIHGWTQRDHYSNQGGPFPPACALGAIGMAAHGHLVVLPCNSGPGRRDARRARQYLTDYLTDLGIIAAPADEWDTTPATVYDWNDRDDQTAETVIATLHAAADEYVFEHATDDERETYAQNELDHDRLPTREGFAAWLGAR